MIEIMPVHYDIAGDLRHYFNSNMKEILLHIEESMRFCEEKKISVGHGKLYWFLKDDQIFFYCNNMLIYHNQIMNAEMQSHPFTEAFMKGGKTLLNENELEQTMIKDALAAYYLIDKEEHENRKSSAMHKKQPFPGTDITREKYQCGSSLFRITAQRRKIQILRNYTQKTAFIFPSERYRMPAHGKVQIFGEENTYPVPDPSKFNAAVSDAKYEYGRGLQNIRALIKALESSEYEKMHRITLYAGWKCQYNAGDSLAASLWIVIDENALVDAENWKIEKLQQYMNLLEQGRYEETLFRGNILQWIEEEKMKKLPYTDSHWTGSVNRCLYIGIACTDEQAEALLASRTKSRIPERKRLLRPFRDRL